MRPAVPAPGQIGDQVLSTVHAVSWTGSDADAFRADAAARIGELSQQAAEAATWATRLRSQADQQDAASDPDGAGTGSGGNPWTLPTIAPWLSGGDSGSDGGEGSDLSKIEKALDDFRDRQIKRLERLVGDGGPKWLRGTKKVLPVVPDLIDAAQHAAHGETLQTGTALFRAELSLSPLGFVDDASGIIFPMMPDDWKYPNSDIPLNEGSLTDAGERYLLENPDPRINGAMERGESFGMDVSDRLGVENQYARNVISTTFGLAAGVQKTQQDPKDDSAWWIGKGMSPFD